MKLKALCAAVAAAVLATPTYAAHFDIGFEVHDGKIELAFGEHDHDHEEEGEEHAEEEGEEHHEEGEPLTTANGKYIFEADFGDFAGGPFATRDPGFAAEDGSLGSSEIYTFNGIGSITFWDGSAWTSETDAAINIKDAFFNLSEWNSTGYNAGSTSYIGQSDAEGGFHQHVDYTINNDADAGAYAIMLNIGDSEGKYAESDSFYIVFNRGLSEEAYEAAVDNLSEVPVPAAGWLMLSALLGLRAVKKSA